MTAVLVLGGGPDDEREVSIRSSEAVAGALQGVIGVEVRHAIIDRPGADELSGLPGDVVFPVLHGPWGEGGPLQELLERGGRPFVGSGSAAARTAMDKIRTKRAAGDIGVQTGEHAEIDAKAVDPPLAFPFVVKPVCEGSSVGLHLCRDAAAWASTREALAEDAARTPGRRFFAERMVVGRELTVALIQRDPGQGLVPLPIVEIAPADGSYDYDAKYGRSDTRYEVAPSLPEGVGARIGRDAARLAWSMGVRHLARVDFLLDALGEPWMLEVNTMPGFTGSSLYPMAARAAGENGAGLALPDLCGHLVRLALGPRWGGGGIQAVRVP